MTFWIIVAVILALVLISGAISDFRRRRRGLSVRINAGAVRRGKANAVARRRAASRRGRF